MTRTDPAPLVIGIGNAWRGDDGAGPAVAERLADELPALVLPGEGTELIEAWGGMDRVVVVDAMRSGVAPGTIRRFDAVAGPLPSGAFACLSHRFALPEAIEMARVLGRLPRELTVWGIEAGDVSPGRRLGPEVEAAVSRLEGVIRSMFAGVFPGSTRA